LRHAVHPHIAEQGQCIVRHIPAARRQRDPSPRCRGKTKGSGHQCGAILRDTSLAVGLEHQPEIAGLEIAQAAVHQLERELVPDPKSC
jgi:hypothetical protein